MLKYVVASFFIFTIIFINVIEYIRPENDTLLMFFLCLIYFTLGSITNFWNPKNKIKLKDMKFEEKEVKFEKTDFPHLPPDLDLK